MANYQTPADSQQVDWSAFYSDVLAPYQPGPKINMVQTTKIEGPIDYGTPRNMNTGSGIYNANQLNAIPFVGSMGSKEERLAPGFSYPTTGNVVTVGPGNMTAAEINANMVAMDMPRRRPNGVGSVDSTTYTPSPIVLSYAPELAATTRVTNVPQVLPGQGNPGVNLAPATEAAAQGGNWFQQMMAGLLRITGGPAGPAFSGAANAPGLGSVSFDGQNVNINIEAFRSMGFDPSQIGQMLQQFGPSFNFENIPALFQMPQRQSYPIDQERVETAWRSGNLSPGAYDALKEGSRSYSSGGAVLPTTAMNGGIRNSYGDTGGSIASDYGTSAFFGSAGVNTEYTGKGGGK